MKRLLCGIGIIFVVLSTMGLTVTADTQTITAIEFTNTGAVPEENLSLSGYGDKDSGYAESTVGGRLYASVSGTDLRKLEWSKGEYGTEGYQPVMTGGTKNPWGSGAYLEVRTSTVGYDSVTFSAQLGATNKGPCDYKLQYSTDGVTFRDVAGAFFTVTANKTMFQAFDKVPLPTAAANAETLFIRITVASNRMVNGTAGLIGSTGGETAINCIVVSGNRTATTTASTAVITTTVASTADKTTDVTTAVAQESTTVAATEETIPNVDTGEDTPLWLFAVTTGTALLWILCVMIRRQPGV